MNSQNNADDSMNFSVIDRISEHEGNIDFSVRQLLENNDQPQKNKEPQVEPNRHAVFNKIKSMQIGGNKTVDLPFSKMDTSQHFLKDLSRMEKQLSFQAECHNIYDDNHNNSTEIIQNNKSKTLSYLKITKEYTSKSISKEILHNFNDYYGELIIDFNKKDQNGKKKNAEKTESKSSSKNLSERSITSKSRRDSKSSKDLNTYFRVKEKPTSSRSKDALHDMRKSKSKSLTHKIRNHNSKSHNNLKNSAQTQTFEEKVFTEYYGTQINFKPKKNQPKKKKEVLGMLKSRQKSSRSKLQIVSPRGVQIKKVTTMKK